MPRLYTPPQGLIGDYRRSMRAPAQPVLNLSDPINRGIVACLPLGDTAVVGSIARDISPFANNGTLKTVNIAPTIAPSHHGGVSLNLSATNRANLAGAYVQLPNSGSLQTSPISCAIWVYISSVPNARSAIFSCNNYPTGVHQALVNSTGKLAFYLSNGATLIDYDGSGTFTLANGQWYLVGFSYDTQHGLTGVLNGLIDGSAAASGNLTFPNAATVLGNDPVNMGRILDGYVSLYRQWNRRINPREWLRLYAEPYAGIVDAWEVFQRRGPVPASAKFKLYNSAKKSFFSTIALNSGNFDLHLAAPGSNFGNQALSTYGSLTGELASAGGYTKSGLNLAGVTWATGASAAQQKWSFTPASLSASANISSVAGYVLVGRTGASAKDTANKLLGFASVGPFSVSSGVTLVLKPPGTGQFTLS